MTRHIFHPYSSGFKNNNNPLKPHAQVQTHVGKFLPQSEQDVQILQVSGEEHKKKERKREKKRNGDLPEKNKVSG
jgi:hypothetical protein